MSNFPCLSTSSFSIPDGLDLVILLRQLERWCLRKTTATPARNSIVLLGDTGVGKSVLVACLLNHALEQRETRKIYHDADGNVVHTTIRLDIGYTDPSLQQDAPIGFSLGPMTESPCSFDLDNATIIDTPGRRNQLCKSVDMANDIGQQRMLHELPAVVPVYLIKASCLSQPNYLKDQLQLVQRMCPVIDEVKDTLLFVFTHVGQQKANDVLDLLYANLVQSDEALSPYISLMIDQVKEYDDTLLVRPLDGNPDGLRELLLAREPLLKGTVCYGSSISMEELTEIQLAVETEVLAIRRAHGKQDSERVQNGLQVLRSLAMNLDVSCVSWMYEDLRRSLVLSKPQAEHASHQTRSSSSADGSRGGSCSGTPYTPQTRKSSSSEGPTCNPSGRRATPSEQVFVEEEVDPASCMNCDDESAEDSVNNVVPLRQQMTLCLPNQQEAQHLSCGNGIYPLVERGQIKENSNDERMFSPIESKWTDLTTPDKDQLLNEKRGNVIKVRQAQRILFQNFLREIRSQNFGRDLDKLIPTSLEVKVCFIGRVSAGKSSAINALLNENVAETGAGTTTTQVAKVGTSAPDRNKVRQSYWDVPGYDEQFHYLDWQAVRTFASMHVIVILYRSTVFDVADIVRLALAMSKPIILVRTMLDAIEPDQNGATEKPWLEVLEDDQSAVKSLGFDGIQVFGVSAKNVLRCTNTKLCGGACNRHPQYDWKEFRNLLTSLGENLYAEAKQNTSSTVLIREPHAKSTCCKLREVSY
eukprot:m.159351 g.159351  ORF g.159351 m.159351 type:complete len:755 (-) comp16490_c0_seq6:108-2372(-)